MINGQRCLVTGGAGTIGSTIVDQLVAADASEVVVLDNFVRGRRENLADVLGSGRVRIVEGDIRDRRLVTDLMAGIDLVFHQAAIRITQCAEEPRLALEALVDGTYEVVEAAADAGVRKVVAASSASVYGLAEEFPTPERHHPYANDTLYGAAKTFNEGLLRSFHAMRGLDYVALRYFNVYGPRMDIYGLYTEVLIRWMERIETGRPPLILGDGLQTMDFVFTGDIARANLLAASADVTRRRLQYRQRDRDQPHRTRPRPAARDGQRPTAGVRAAQGRERGDPPTGRRLTSRGAPRLEGGSEPGRGPAAVGDVVARAATGGNRTVRRTQRQEIRMRPYGVRGVS